MSALAEALVAAQARSLAAIQKIFLAGGYADDLSEATFYDALDSIGCTDKAEQVYLYQNLKLQRSMGTAAPPEAKTQPDRSKATDAQLSLMRKLASERNYTLPDDPQLLSRDQASKVIDDMKAGEYDQSAWAVPF